MYKSMMQQQARFDLWGSLFTPEQTMGLSEGPAHIGLGSAIQMIESQIVYEQIWSACREKNEQRAALEVNIGLLAATT